MVSCAQRYFPHDCVIYPYSIAWHPYISIATGKSSGRKSGAYDRIGRQDISDFDIAKFFYSLLLFLVLFMLGSIRNRFGKTDHSLSRRLMRKQMIP